LPHIYIAIIKCSTVYNVYSKVITRRLATANRSFFASAFVVDPVKIFLTSSLITVLILVVVFLCAHVTGPKNFEDAGAPPYYDGAWLVP